MTAWFPPFDKMSSFIFKHVEPHFFLLLVKWSWCYHVGKDFHCTVFQDIFHRSSCDIYLYRHKTVFVHGYYLSKQCSFIYYIIYIALLHVLCVYVCGCGVWCSKVGVFMCVRGTNIHIETRDWCLFILNIHGRPLNCQLN